ncbi:MAG: ice-binding family protein [Verrucomicrobiota bacterium]
MTGDMGVSPIAGSAITGFSLVMDRTGTFSRSTQVNGKIYAANYASPTPSNLTTAVSNMRPRSSFRPLGTRTPPRLND